MKRIFFAFLLSQTLIYSCQSPDKRSNKSEPKSEKRLSQEEILKDFRTWYNYTYFNIRLAQDFIGLNTDSIAINKANFLTQLETGNFVPFKIATKDNVAVYKLIKLQQPDKDIQSTIKQMASIEEEHFKMEEKDIPDYNFTDLNGRKYSKANTKGNTLLLKCWFINCVACVKEFPELNGLVDKYHDKKDLLFVSLAIDSQADLISFLSKKQFKYAVVPNEEKYMSEKLAVTAYPTHILINKEGKIIKVTNSIDDMIPFLEKQVE